MQRLDETFLDRLETLRLACRRQVRGFREGDRATARRGGSGDFHSHRGYVPGDDLRRVDWNAYARLGSMFIREHARDEAPPVHLFLDTSASMGRGKLEFAARLAAAVGAIALGELAPVQAQGGRTHSRLSSLLDDLGALRPEGPCRIAEQTATLKGTGAIILFFSDFWDEELRGPVLSATAHGNVGAVHVLSPEEVSPSPEGRVRFVDSESGEACTRFVGEAERARYAELFEEHCGSWKRWWGEHEISHARCTRDQALEEAVLVLLREGGLIE